MADNGRAETCQDPAAKKEWFRGAPAVTEASGDETGEGGLNGAPQSTRPGPIRPGRGHETLHPPRGPRGKTRLEKTKSHCWSWLPCWLGPPACTVMTPIIGVPKFPLVSWMPPS